VDQNRIVFPSSLRHSAPKEWFDGDAECENALKRKSCCRFLCSSLCFVSNHPVDCRHRWEEYGIKSGIQIRGQREGHGPVAIPQPRVVCGKRIHAPGPIPVKTGAVLIRIKQFVCYGRLAHARRAGDDDQLLQVRILPYSWGAAASSPTLITGSASEDPM